MPQAFQARKFFIPKTDPKQEVYKPVPYYFGTLSTQDAADQIAEESSLTKGDVLNVLDRYQRYVIKNLQKGYKVELLGFDGCTDNQYAVNLLISFIRHPNAGAVLAVGLGCEYVQPEWLSKIADEEGKPTSWMFIQNEGGTQPAIRKGMDWVQNTLKELENTPRVEMSVKDLVIGAECGGSDYTSGLAGNVVVGRFQHIPCQIHGIP